MVVVVFKLFDDVVFLLPFRHHVAYKHQEFQTITSPFTPLEVYIGIDKKAVGFWNSSHQRMSFIALVEFVNATFKLISS